MSSIDNCSSCSGSTENNRNNIIYNSTHCVDVLYSNGNYNQRNILFIIIKLENAVASSVPILITKLLVDVFQKFKLRDTTEYSFNFTIIIDRLTFDRMKQEQMLDISFEEFQPQIIELLKQTSTKQMQMRLEAINCQCKVIFYEKSRIKSLIFLTIDLELTNQKELIEEMSTNIMQLQELNKNSSSQLAITRNQLHETETLWKSAISKNAHIEKRFQEDLERILQTFIMQLNNVQTKISTEISKLTKRHQKILKDVEKIRTENRLKCESTARVMQSMRNLRLENDHNNKRVEDLQLELETLRAVRTRIEQNCIDLHQSISGKDKAIECLQKELGEVKRDIQDATMIIAQKTKTNDEIGKDLIEANRLLVNFNSQYDLLSNEVDQLKERLACKDEIIRGQVVDLEKINIEFQNYRSVYNSEEMQVIQHELFLTRQKVEELEKQNKDAVKLNGLLTKKLSNGDIFETRSSKPMPPK